MTRRKPLTLNAGKLERLPDSGAIAGVASVRQTALSGSVDSNGSPNALSAGLGLAVTLTATNTPFLVSFAAGFDSNGTVDYLGQFTANQSFSALTANTTLYLYIDRDATTGALTLGFTTTGYAYTIKAPTSPVTGFHWFDLSTFTMKQWSGSAWSAVQRVFVGECATGASNVSSATTYAYRGYFASSWIAVVANTNYTVSHNLGIQLASANPAIGIYTSVTGTDGDAVLANPALVFSGLVYGYQLTNSGVSPWKTFQFSTRDYVLINASNTWLTTGYYSIKITRGW